MGPWTLGVPTGPVEWDGPVVVQYFESPHVPDYMVICAWPSTPPVAMPGNVWDALRTVGGGAGVAALGLPDASSLADPSAPLVGLDATEVKLRDGSLGPGRLVRDPVHSSWRWEPQPQITTSITGRHAWSEEWGADLRLRVYAALPWQGQSVLAVDRAGRERLLRALGDCELSRSLAALTHSRGADFPIGPWELDRARGSYQSSRSAQYTAVVQGPGGQPGLTMKVMLSCPSAMQAVVTTNVEIRVDFAVWAAAVETAGAPGQELRLTLQEVLGLLVGAWNVATGVAPLALMPDPTAPPLAGPPRVEFYLESTSGEAGTSDPNLDLHSYIDLSAFGEPPNDRLSQMSTAVIAPVKFDEQARRTWVTRALVDMAHNFGFIDADEDDLAT